MAQKRNISKIASKNAENITNQVEMACSRLCFQEIDAKPVISWVDDSCAKEGAKSVKGAKGARGARSAKSVRGAKTAKGGEREITFFLSSDFPTNQLLALLPKGGGKGRFSCAAISSGEELPEAAVELLCKAGRSALIGVQRYLFPFANELRINSAGGQILRLGELRDDITEAEPLLREAEYIFVDMRSVRHADYPSSSNTNPNGLFANELCQIAHYIGFSTNLKAVYLFGLEAPQAAATGTGTGFGTDAAAQVCANLAAQLIWHISDGVANNVKEEPALQKRSGKLPIKFEYRIVEFASQGDSITFITSLITGRWWMEIPLVKKGTNKLIPCSKNDYELACQGDIPLRWLFFYNHLNK